MKLLLKQEAELRQKTRQEILREPQESLSFPALQTRCNFLLAQINHSFHINEQITNALTEQFLIIQDRDSKVKALTDELDYTRSYTLNQLSLFQDDLVSAYASSPDFKPSTSNVP